MNARLIKEAREQLPMLIGTLLLIILPYLVWQGRVGEFGCVVLGVSCAVLGGCAFGMEFQHRTFLLLLSQPLPRSVMWRDKMVVLGASIGISIAATLICFRVYGPVRDLGFLLPLGLIGLCAFCGGPYWTLTLHHSVGGMAFAAGAPLGLLGVFMLITQRLTSGEHFEPTGAVILTLLYCAFVYWRGYAAFQRLEACERSGRELSLPAGIESRLAIPLARLGAKFRGPFATLAKKELRLQQVSFLLAGVFFLVALLGFCVRPFHPGLGEGIMGGAYGLFMVLLPLIAGALAVTEEKGWDMAEWHLTLPPSAGQQWTAKMLAALSTSLFLGLGLPTALFLTGKAVLNPGLFRGMGAPPFELAGWVLGQLLLTSVAMYAASVCKSTVKAIFSAFVMAASGLMVVGVAGRAATLIFEDWGMKHRPGEPDLASPAVIGAGLILLLCLIQWFAWANFRRLGASAWRVFVQVLSFLLAVGVLTGALVAAGMR